MALVGLLIAGSIVPTGPAAAQDAGLRLRVSLSCAAYALSRTGEYPETIRVYQEGKEARTQEEAGRALAGLRWTNRAFFSRHGFAAEAWEDLHGSAPTHGELRTEVGKWLELLNEADRSQRESIHANCRQLFEYADEVCAKRKCVALP